jgi:uncharacterized membrane protein
MVQAQLLILYAIGTLITVLAGVTGMIGSIRKGIRVPRLLQYLVLTMPVYLLIAQFLKLYAHKDYADFTVSSEIVLNITRGLGPWSSLQDGFVPGSGHWFSSHFTPLIYLFAVPFLWLQRPEILLLCQFIVLLSAVLAVYLYAKHWLGSRQYALIVAGVFALYPTYQYIHLYEFEMLRFSIPLLLFAFYALERGKLGWYWLCFGLALLVREEVAITTCLLGLYTLVCIPSRRRVGAVTMGISLAYFVVVLQIVMPAFRTGNATEHVAAYWFAPLGTTLPEILMSLITKPQVVLALLLDPIKLANVFVYGLPLLFLPLLAWPVLLISAGNIGVNMLSESITHTTYFLYYLAPSIPFIFIAFIKGVARLGAILDRRVAAEANKGKGVAAVLCGVFATAMVANGFFGPSPLSLQFWFKDYRLAPFRTQNFHYSQYIVTQRDWVLHDVVTAVPHNAIVSAEQHILPVLYDRKGLKVFPDIEGVEYVVIDKLRKEKTGVGTVPDSWDGLRQNPQYYYDWVEQNVAQWTLVTSQEGYFIYKRRDP